jgi:hypothetical protein
MTWCVVLGVSALLSGLTSCMCWLILQYVSTLNNPELDAIKRRCLGCALVLAAESAGFIFLFVLQLMEYFHD